MARIYLSSTYADLVEHRRAVEAVLREMQHDVRQMEHYGAEPQRPLAACLEDVGSCDLYVGVFAWRYGYVPLEGEGRSITECELREAEARGIPCLVFLLDEEASWPPSQIDEDRTAIKRLRAYLGEAYLRKLFRTPDDLAASVSAAVINALQEAAPEADPADPAALDLYEHYIDGLSKVEEDKIRVYSLAARATPVLGGSVTVVGLVVQQVALGLGGLLLASVTALALPTLFSARRNKALLDAYALALKRRPPDESAVRYVKRALAGHAQ